MSFAVYLDRSPHNGRLVAWGRTPAGEWWGAITFHARVRVGGEPDELAVAAWLPGGSIRPGRSQPERLPRIDLAHDRKTWPAPPGWPSWYAGPWVAGPLPLPSGVELITGPAWRQRRRG